MKRVVGGALATLVAIVTTFGGAAPAAAADLTDTGAAALAQAASCAAAQKSLLVAIVVDESGSLQGTDPDDLRAEAIVTVLNSMKALADSDGDVTVEASLATFGSSYNELVGWGSATGAHWTKLRDAATGQLPKRNQDTLTDYRVALKGAQKSINARAAATNPEACKLMLWFTDGKLDVENNRDGSTGPPTDAAAKEICTEQGIADSVRADNIAVVAMALFTEGASNSPTREDRERLWAIAEGEAPTETCGTIPVPPTWSKGAYLRADDASALSAVFALAGALIEGGSQDASGGCPSARCIAGTLVVPMDRGVPRARVSIHRDLADRPLTVVAPDGSRVALTEGDHSVADASASVSSSPGLTTVELALPSESGAVGDWRFDLGDSDVSADVIYFWDARLLLETPEAFVLGETASVPITLVGLSGEPMDPSVYASFDPRIAEGVPEGVDVEFSADKRVLHVTLSGATVPPEISLAIEATAITAPTGIELGPIYARGVAASTPPPDYPSLVTTNLDFGDMVGNTESTAVLTIRGSERGATEACFEAGELSAPEGAGAVTLADVPCVEVPSGTVVNVEFELTAEHPADGRVDGALLVTVTGVDTDTTLEYPVEVRASMERPVDEAKRWALVAGLVALAVLVAWATALLGRHFADRFRFGPAAQYCAVDVEITPEGLRRLGGNSAELIDPVEDFGRVAPIGANVTTTSMDIAGLQYRRKSPFNPLRSARGVVSAPGRVVAFGEHAEVALPDGSLAPARFPGTTDFLLVADPSDIAPTHVKGRLVMVLDAPNGVSAVLPDRLADLRQVQWPDVLLALNAAAAARREGAAIGGPPGKVRASGPALLGDDGATGTSDAAVPGLPANEWLLGDEPSPTPAARPKESGRSGRTRRSRPGKAKPSKASDNPPRDEAPPPPTDFLS